MNSHVDNVIYKFLVMNSSLEYIRQAIWKEFEYNVYQHGIECMIQRSIQNPKKRFNLDTDCGDCDDDYPIDYDKYTLIGIAIVGIIGIIGYCFLKLNNYLL